MMVKNEADKELKRNVSEKQVWLPEHNANVAIIILVKYNNSVLMYIW